jgi:anti-sigma B factor antagonist
MMVDGSEGNFPHRLHRQAMPRRSHPPLAPAPLEQASGSFSTRVEKRRGDADVLTVCGEVDLATAPLLRETLQALIEDGSGPVVVDLSEVPFMDSSGVHVLVESHRALVSRNRRLAVACRPHGQIHKLLALVGLLDLLTVHRSLGSAVTGGSDLIRPA